MLKSVAIVGAGQAGFQVAASLRQDGYAGRVTLVGDEPGLPYQRPPLSKGYLLGKVDAEGLHYRSADFFAGHGVELVHGRAVAIDRTNRRVTLEHGAAVDYEHLVLAVGAHNRALPVPGADLDGVFGLRTLADADLITSRLQTAADVVVVGAGFIGLEFACVARSRGAAVHVLELADRPMARALSAESAAAFRAAHEASGIRFDFHQGLARIEGTDGRVGRVRTTAGTELGADVVVFGIGVLPNTALAAEAGLHIENGIKVDAHLLTSDPAISAIGDAASFPSSLDGTRIRLESVQNAVDQARAVAARLTGKPQSYAALPWFWSDQGEMRLQIAGLSYGVDATVLVGDVGKRQFSALCFRREQLVAVESVNRPGDHMAARRLLARLPTLTARHAAEPGFDLRAFEASTR
jgi:3-phenylpropionate/trans-cinnamate dioxygenase ferredoxin reductase subunit